MPRALNPALLSVGGGLANAKSVEATSFVHPTQGLDGLIAHIVDPSRAHQAQAIQVVDIAGYFASDDVEGALAELASSHAATTQNGVLVGCTYTSVGLVVTLDTPSSVVVGGTERDLSGDSIVLTNTATNWVYAHGTTGVLSVFVGVAPPNISPVEHVLLWKFTTGGGSIVTFRDARWFVQNIDRKLPMTVRVQGSAGDAHSEASFETIDSAILYLENFGVSGSIRNTTIIIKGTQTITSQVTVPLDNVTFQGEDGCVLSTGASLAPMFNISGRTKVRFKDIGFTCAHAASSAIGATSAVSDILVERCEFTSGASNWVTAIDLDYAGDATRVTVRDSQITSATYGVRVRRPVGFRATDLQLSGITTGAGTYGFLLGPTAGPISTSTDVVLRGCTVTSYEVGGFLRTLRGRVENCNFLNNRYGFQTGADSEDVTIAESSVNLDSTVGEIGLDLNGAGRIKVIGCRINNQRAGGAYTAEIPMGIGIQAIPTQVSVLGTTISNFYNSVANEGYGIYSSSASNHIISDCQIDTVWGAIATDGGSGIQISGCLLRLCERGVDLATNQSFISDTRIILDSTRGKSAIVLDTASHDTKISGCRIENQRTVYGGGDAGFMPIGVSVTASNNVMVSDCHIKNFYNSTGDLGQGVTTTGACADLVVSSSLIEEVKEGISVSATSTNGRVVNVQIRECGTALSLLGNTWLVEAVSAVLDSTRGILGFVLGDGTANGYVVTGCRIENPRAGGSYALEVPVGITVTATDVKVVNSYLSGFENTAGFGAGVLFGTGSDVGSVVGTEIIDCYQGIQTQTAVGTDSLIVSGCILTNMTLRGIYTENSSILNVSGCQITSGGSTSAIAASNCVDITITDNYIDGDVGDTDVGISISGLNTSADRVRRVIVSNNNIHAIGAQGILLSGFVQNGTVTGNQIDGRLPGSSFDPTAEAGIKLISTASGVVITDIAVTSNTVWRCQNGILAVGTDLYPVTNVTINGNSVHHCGVAFTAPAADTFAGAGSKGIGAEHGREMVISGNVIRSIGLGLGDDTTTGFPTAGGPDVSSAGIYCLNCSRMVVSSNTVEDTVSTGAGSNSGIYMNQRTSGSASTIFQTRGITVANNELRWVSGLPGNGVADVGLVVTMTKGTEATTTDHEMATVVVTGNSVRNTEFSGLSVTIGDRSTLTGLVVDGNNIALTSSSGDGLLILLYKPGLGLGDSHYTDARVSNNVLSGIGANGISLISTNGNSSEFERMVVDGNILNNCNNRGIYCLASDVTSFSDISVTGNRINDLGPTDGYGVHFSCTTSSVTDFNRLTASRNTITDQADGGIYISSAGEAVSNIVIDGNEIHSGVTTYAPGFGIRVETTSGSVDINRVHIADNNVRSEDNGIWVDVEDGEITDLTVADNYVETNTAANTCFVNLTRASNVTAACNHLVFTGNTFIGGNRLLYIPTTNNNFLKELIVSDNVFFGPSGAGTNGLHISVDIADGGDVLGPWVITNNIFERIRQRGILIDLYNGSVVQNTLRNVSISGNSFRDCASTGGQNDALKIAGNGRIQNLNIIGNMFAEGGNSETTASGAITVEIGGKSTSTLSGENIIISNNSINGWTGAGIKVEDSTSGALDDWTLVNLKVDGNAIQGCTNDGIRLDLSAFVAVRNISVNNNNIDNISATATSDAGIVVFGPSTITSPGVITASLARLSIIGNMLRGTGDGATGAIHVDAVDNAEDIVIDQNTIDDSGDSGIFLNMDLAATSVSVSRNVITSPAIRGIHLSAGGTGTGTEFIRNLTVDGNIIENPTGHGIFLTVANPSGTLGPDLLNMSFCGNTVRSAGLTGLTITFNGVNDDCDLQNCVISNNVFADLVAEAIYIEADTDGEIVGLNISGNTINNVAGGTGTVSGGAPSGAITVYHPGAGGGVFGLDITGNSIINTNYAGICIRADCDDISGVTIASNQLRDFNAGGAVSTTLFGGVHFRLAGASNVNTVVVATNTCYSSNDYATCLLFLVGGGGGDVRTINVIGNTGTVGGANSRSIVFENSGANALGLSFVANTFRGAITGVTYTDTGGNNVDYSQCSNNTERTSAGAGNWGTGGAGTFTDSTIWTAGTTTTAENQD